MKIKNYIYIILFFSVIPFIAFTQNIYQKDTLTILADSLHNDGEYKKALLVREQALKEATDYPVDYLLYIKAKYYLTKTCIYEKISYDYYDYTVYKKKKYLDSALTNVFKARSIYQNIKKPDKQFLYDLQNRIYHQTAYLGNWKHSLIEAQKGLAILKDTLSPNDKIFVNLIYDIGFIYSKLGDYSRAVENFQKSLDLYNNVAGNNQLDIAQAYNNIAKNYKNLGFKKTELNSLLKAKGIWENKPLDETNTRLLYDCYQSLFEWYLYYGDVSNSEKYLAKMKEIREKENIDKVSFLRFEEEIDKDKLKNWHNYTLYYLVKKDTINALKYIHKTIDLISKRRNLNEYQVQFYTDALKRQAEIVKKSNPKKSLISLNKSIDIVSAYKQKYYLDEIPLNIEKSKLLIHQKKYGKAQTLLLTIDKKIDKKNYLQRFHTRVLLGQTYYLQKEKKRAEQFFNQALNLVLKDGNIRKFIILKDLKSAASFETIDDFLKIGDFYFDRYKENKTKKNIQNAYQYYFLASQIFNSLYLGQRYNHNLYNIYEKINQKLINCTLLDSSLISKTLNEIENNESKLTWSKFIFNNKRKQINLSDSLIDFEEKLKAELNFYKTKLYSTDNPDKDKKELWKDKIYELEDKYTGFKDSIKTLNKSYYKFGVEKFDVQAMQNGLDNNSAILKYLSIKDSLYAFVILKDSIKLTLLGQKSKISKVLSRYLTKINFRENDYKEDQVFLKNILFKSVALNRIKELTIIPTENLYYLPFELLIFDKNMPLISYSTSLHLLKDQKKEQIQDAIKLGAFTSAINSIDDFQNTNSFDLNYANQEIENILYLFDGTIFVNSSKKTFLKNANNFNVLHLVMHSSLNKKNPEFSSLNFYGNPDQNKLFISEIYNESLNANLVVLSSCDTGSGVYENGEGVISISRAFTYAGVPSSVISLWKVPDKETSELMLFFYKHLKNGLQINDALHRAKVDYLESKSDVMLKHPYFWAGFVVSGNTAPILIPDENSYSKIAFWVVLGLILIPLGGYFLYKLV